MLTAVINGRENLRGGSHMPTSIPVPFIWESPSGKETRRKNAKDRNHEGRFTYWPKTGQSKKGEQESNAEFRQSPPPPPSPPPSPKGGWHSGESARLPPTWPGFDSRTRRHMWVEFVVDSGPCFEGFSPGTPGFSPSLKTNISKIQFDLKIEGHRFVSVMTFRYHPR